MLKNKRVLLTFSVILFLVLLLNSILAQQIYAETPSQKVFCCCSEKSGEQPYGSATSDALCPQGYKSKEFTGQQAIFSSCSDLCGVPISVEVPVCSNPNHNPTPEITKIESIKGEHKLKLKFKLDCPGSIKQLSIKKCEGTECTPTNSQIIPNEPEYIDNVEFGKNYKYVVEATYLNDISKQSPSVSKYSGDIECLGRTENVPFCVFQSSYEEKDTLNYLKQYGYRAVANTDFLTSIENRRSKIDLLFNIDYRAAFQCNEDNKKIEATDDSNKKVRCNTNQICKVTSSTKAKCIDKTSCDQGSPFGLFFNQNNCGEGCYADKSTTTIDKCYSCPTDKKMQCNDYKSENACGKASTTCGPSECAWKPIYPVIGIGVCVDPKKDNCKNCEKPKQDDLNADVFNSLFDVCTIKKAELLETDKYKCLFDSSGPRAKNCDEVACTDYKKEDCKPPSNEEGIRIDGNNKIVSSSTDKCGIGKCEYAANAGCFKNSDGSKDPKKDCEQTNPSDRRKCEEDYFPPETTLSVTETNGATNRIYITVKDRTKKTEELQVKIGATTFLCFNNTATGCEDKSKFTSTKAPELIVGNGFVMEALKGGKNLKLDFQEGVYTLRYYTEDSYKNLEVIKDATIKICLTCQGPSVRSKTVEGAQEFEKKFYTKKGRPKIEIEFDTSVKIFSAQISNQQKTTWTYLGTSPDNFQDRVTLDLQPSESSLNDGAYAFELKAVNNKGLQLASPLKFDIIIDNVAPSLEIANPKNMSSLSKDVNTELNLNKVGKINSLNLEKEVPLSIYAASRTSEDIKDLLKDAVEFKKKFGPKIKSFEDGRYKIIANVQDLAGNSAFNESIFFVSSGENKMLLVSPPFGASRITPFNIALHTTKISECKYTTHPAIDITNSQLSSAYNGMTSSFDSKEGYTHTVNRFDDLKTDGERTLLKVVCKEGNKFTGKEFDLILDTSPPIIEQVDALQKTLIEPEISLGGVDYYTTNLTATLNEPGFCKYLVKKEGSPLKEGDFFEYDLFPKQFLTTKINVTSPGEYEFEISCKNAAGSFALKNEIVKIIVNPQGPFEVTSRTKSEFKNEDIELKVETNKRALCMYKEDDPKGSYNKFQNQNQLAITHVKKISPNKDGRLSYVVTCTSENKETKDITISLLRDSTPPQNVKAEIISDTESPLISWKDDKIKVKFSAEDSETGVKGFWYKLESAGKTVSDWTFTSRLSGEEFYIQTTNDGNVLQLLNGGEYSLKVKAENGLGLNSTEVSSNKVKIDITKQPQPCQNKQQDPGELGIDCGGLCEPCPEQTSCQKDVDCATGSCVNNKCTIQACNNNFFDKDTETDKDCGKTCAKKCDVAQKCVSNSDCASNSCKSGKCTAPIPCNGTDTKCGGDCDDRCPEEKGCLKDNDCESNLFCSPLKVCKKALDKDQDGVPDSIDKCPYTPPNSRDKVKKTGATAGCTDEQINAPVTPTPTKPTPTKTTSPTVSPSPGKTPTKTQTTTPKPVTQESKPWIKYILIVVILAALGYGGFYAYSTFAKKPEVPEEFPGLGPLPKQIEMPKLEIKPKQITPFGRPMHPIKRQIIPKAKPKIMIPKKEEFIPLEQLKERVKGYEKKDVFEKLKKYQPKKEPKLEHETKTDVFEKLKKYKKSK